MSLAADTTMDFGIGHAEYLRQLATIPLRDTDDALMVN